jgi:hypothetical protein
MTFDQMLSELVTLNGERVEVTATSKERYPDIALAASGVILLGTEVTGSAAGSSFERFFFAFRDHPSSGFFLDRSTFERANRWGDELRINSGGLVMSIRSVTDDA